MSLRVAVVVSGASLLSSVISVQGSCTQPCAKLVVPLHLSVGGKLSELQKQEHFLFRVLS